MAYIDDTYFKSYTGAATAPTGFAIMEARASAIIDELTMDKIPRAGGISSLPSFIQDRVKKAVAEQVHTMDLNGGSDALASPDMASVGLGKFSYSTKANTDTGGLSVGGVPVSPMVIIYLASTGLLYRGSSCYD